MQWLTGPEQKHWFEKIIALRGALWPDYQRLDEKTMWQLYENHADFQWLLHTRDEVVAIINALPITVRCPPQQLPAQGLNWILSQLYTTNHLTANGLAAISATINPKYQGRGLSATLVTQLQLSAKAANLSVLIVPARPSQKHLYPLIHIDDYLTWKRSDGRHFDPWLRTHEQLGGQIYFPCYESRFIRASSAQWEKWLGYPLPQSGQYLIPDGLNPMVFDKAEEEGIYIEPNVWVVYSLDKSHKRSFLRHEGSRHRV